MKRFSARRREKPGYSVLELLIALGLLGTLMALAWSMLGTYRSAEQRAWDQSYRLQVMRVARQWLTADLLQVVELRGTSRGFEGELLVSTDPVGWVNDAVNGLPRSSSAAGLDPRRRQRIEYSLVPLGESEEEPLYSLKRIVQPRTEWKNEGWEEGREDRREERELTLNDLYRLEEREGVEEVTEGQTDQELQGLLQPRFRYFDGTKWHSSWDSQLSGSLPAAIELSFDFARSEDLLAVQETSEETLGEEPASPSDLVLGLALETVEMDVEESEQSPRDVVVVARLRTAMLLELGEQP